MEYNPGIPISSVRIVDSVEVAKWYLLSIICNCKFYYITCKRLGCVHHRSPCHWSITITSSNLSKKIPCKELTKDVFTFLIIII